MSDDVIFLDGSRKKNQSNKLYYMYFSFDLKPICEIIFCLQVGSLFILSVEVLFLMTILHSTQLLTRYSCRFSITLRKYITITVKIDYHVFA